MKRVTTPCLPVVIGIAAVGILCPLCIQSAELSGAVAPVAPGVVIDLSAEGRLDWAHWGLEPTSLFDHRSDVAQQISDASMIGTGVFEPYSTNLHEYRWSNGTPTASATNTATGISVTGLDNGFAITTPADATVRRLKVYVGVSAARGQLEATLSDGSAPSYLDTSLDSPSGTTNGVYTLHYAAASAGQSLSIRFTVTALYEPGPGNVTWQAATLATNLPPTVAVTSPTNNAVFYAGQGIGLSASTADSDGIVTNVEYFQGIFSMGQAAESPYNVTWSNALPGDYTLTAVATDNEGATQTSAAVSIRVIPNPPPTVALTNPPDGAGFLAPATIELGATAFDTNGTISKVEFFQGDTKIGERTNPPYTLSWTGVTVGAYLLTARATDNGGAVSDSSPVTIFVTITGGSLSGSVTGVPTGADVSLTSEGLADWAHWGLFTEGSFDHKGGVIPLISGYSLVGTEPAYPYADNFNGYSWSDGTPTRSVTNSPTGVYVAGLRNGFQVSAPADTGNKTLKLYVGTYGARGRFRAYLSDFTAPVYQDSSLVNFGNGAGVVYTLSYAAASTGQVLVVTYTVSEIHAAHGNVTLQAATLVTDNLPPFAAIATPTNGSVLPGPTNLTIEATAWDSDGSISKVEFFEGATKFGQATNTPYRFVLTNAAAGPHSFTVRATDDRGVTFTSFPADVYVTAGGGLLAGSTGTPTAQLNLSQEGRTDWAHWGLQDDRSFNRHRLVPQRINNYAQFGTEKATRYADNYTAFTWTNGSPTLAATNTTTGLFIGGLSNGFQFSVAADAMRRRLKVYVGLNGAQGRLEASLSDCSAAPYTDTSLNRVYGNAYAVHTIDFAAASTNQSLFVKYTALAIYDPLYGGNVTLQAATLTTLVVPAPYLRNVLSDSEKFRFSFFSEPDFPYTVLSADTPDSTNWVTLTNLSGSGAEMFVTNFAPLPSQRWYRVRSP